MRSTVVCVLSVLVLLTCVAAPALAQQPFADVPLNHWAYNAVNSLAEQGLLEGYPDGTFKGKQRLTRYEFAQALARLIDRLEQVKGIPGPPGPQGPAGPPGPPGAGGLTDEQQALVDRLAKEFGPELKALRSDLDELAKSVEDLEAAPAAKAPVVRAGGDISWRLGLAGTNLGIEDVETTGYPFFEELMVYEDGIAPGGFGSAVAPYGGINIPFYDPAAGMWSDDASYVGGPLYIGAIPISDALKDAYKPSDFMTMKTRVNLLADLADGTDVYVSLLAGPENNNLRAPATDDVGGSPLIFSGNGVMDTVSVDEAWLKRPVRVLVPAELTVGKQYVSRGQGLLADNDQEALKGLRLDWDTGGSLSWGVFLGMLDREQFWGRTAGAVGLPALDPPVAGQPDPQASGQDNYNLYYLDQALGRWDLGANWLESGFNQEQGWSVSLENANLNFYGELSQLTKWPTGVDVSATGLDLGQSDTAWVVGWAPTPIFEYGQVDAGYAFAPDGGGWSAVHPLFASYGMYTDYFNLPLSALHPNAEVDPHDINWIDRPLFLDPTNIAKGWRVTVPIRTTPEITVSYMDGDAYEPRYLHWLSEGGPASGIPEPDKWTDADSVWIVTVSQQLSANVNANLVYGRREVENVMSRQTVQIPNTGSYAENDPIQVIRAEVTVGF